VDRLQGVRVLDPACGSGNFLYVVLQKLKDLEKVVGVYADSIGLGGFLPMVGPWQLHGIEANAYAFDLAQTTVCIGWLQWIRANGFGVINDPILRPLEGFRRMDAILDLSDPANPRESDWPEAEFIVGNPPFLGTKKLRSELGDEYVEKLFRVYSGRLPPFSDLCCYWFEKARAQIEAGRCKRAGLLATQGIRGGLNREALKRIKETGDIFFAESDRDWVLDGANVHVSMVGFDDGREAEKVLDGKRVADINPNLTATADTTTARKLPQNQEISFYSDVKAGRFEVSFAEANRLLSSPNPNGRPNSDVLRPWANGRDVVQRPRHMWVIDFGWSMRAEEASLYEAPFRIVKTLVKPERDKVKRKRYREYWWLHAEPCAEMRRRIEPLERYLVTTTLSKHRVFAWMQPPTLPDHQLIVFARSDDYFFGVLHSRAHEVWALEQGTQLEDRPRYTPTTSFETLPFPEPTAEQEAAIAAAAKDLDGRRNAWLNPPEWTKADTLEFPGSAGGPWKRYVQDADARGIGTVRFPRTVAKDAASEAELKKRTLTNLYNERPAWLRNAHAALDGAAFAAYGWPHGLTDEEILARLLDLNRARAGAGA
jgi:type II restriction/modification system DNA methylase subunit YeeA